MGAVHRSRNVLGADADLDYNRAEEQIHKKRIEVRLGSHPVRASDQWVSKMAILLGLSNFPILSE